MKAKDISYTKISSLEFDKVQGMKILIFDSGEDWFIVLILI